MARLAARSSRNRRFLPVQDGPNDAVLRHPFLVLVIQYEPSELCEYKRKSELPQTADDQRRLLH